MPPGSSPGPSFGSCNCDYGCPCQFESKPILGHCCGFEAVEILEGRFGDTKLDSLRFVMRSNWPGPIYEGRATADEAVCQADAAVRR